MAYLAQSTFAMARAPMRVPAVGYRQLEKPSPNWKAWTATCLVMPTRSAMGTIKGITAAAWPDPEGIRKLIRRLAMNMKFAPITDPMLEIGMESQLTMVFRIWPWDRITPDAIGKSNNKRRIGHFGAAIDKFLRGPVDAHSVEQTTAYGQDKEGCRHLVIAPGKFNGADHDHRDGCHQPQKADHMLPGHGSVDRFRSFTFCSHKISHGHAFLIVQALHGILPDRFHITHREEIADGKINDIQQDADLKSRKDGKLRNGMRHTDGSCIGPSYIKAGVSAHVNKQEASKRVVSKAGCENDPNGDQSDNRIGKHTCCAAHRHKRHDQKSQDMGVELLIGSQPSKGRVDGSTFFKYRNGASAEHDHEDQLG